MTFAMHKKNWSLMTYTLQLIHVETIQNLEAKRIVSNNVSNSRDRSLSGFASLFTHVCGNNN